MRLLASIIMITETLQVVIRAGSYIRTGDVKYVVSHHAASHVFGY